MKGPSVKRTAPIWNVKYVPNQKDEYLDSRKPWVCWLEVGLLEAVLCLSLTFFCLVAVERACQENRTKKWSLPSNVSLELELIFKGFDFILLITLIHLSLSNNKCAFLHYVLLHRSNCSLSQSYHLPDRFKTKLFYLHAQHFYFFLFIPTGSNG